MGLGLEEDRALAGREGEVGVRCERDELRAVRREPGAPLAFFREGIGVRERGRQEVRRLVKFSGVGSCPGQDSNLEPID